jgi:hypothetical protein
MSRREFDGFTAIVPEGWAAAFDEATYSDATYTDAGSTHLPTRLVCGEGGGELIVSMPRLHPDDQPGADTDELESLAREWGMRRGVDEPISVTTEVRRGVARASATYRIGDELVEVWFISNGTALLKATYVCPWADRDRGWGAREALVGSIAFT